MSPYVLLAKSAVESYIRERKIIDVPEEFSDIKSGVFVTIVSLREISRREKKQGQLRGCIGTYLPTKENIAEEIISNAIAAATEDYRFGPIKEEELPELSYTVYILSEPELVRNIKELNPKKYGIIIKTVPISESGDVMFDGHAMPKSGLLLPDLEGVDTAEQQISIACQKGGINPEIENIIIYKFTAEKYE